MPARRKNLAVFLLNSDGLIMDAVFGGDYPPSVPETLLIGNRLDEIITEQIWVDYLTYLVADAIINRRTRTAFWELTIGVNPGFRLTRIIPCADMDRAIAIQVNEHSVDMDKELSKVVA